MARLDYDTDDGNLLLSASSTCDRIFDVYTVRKILIMILTFFGVHLLFHTVGKYIFLACCIEDNSGEQIHQFLFHMYIVVNQTKSI